MESFEQLGLMLWPLLACSVTGLALILERTLYFIRHRCRRSDLELIVGSDAHLLAKDRDYSAFPLKNSPLMPLTSAFFQNALYERTIRKDAVEAAAKAWLSRARAPIKLMATIAQIAPLLGLTGTVLGLVETFKVIQSSQGSVNPSLMAGGIWEALLTTIVGMLITIPLLLSIRFFNARIETISSEIRTFFVWLEKRHLTSDLQQILSLEKGNRND
jgi:biopolymer transport protein ExbB